MMNSNTLWGIFSILLLLGVVFANGFTDASTSVTSVVVTKIMSIGQASVLSGIFNLLGVGAVSLISLEMAEGISELGGIYGNRRGVCAVLLTVIIFSYATWLLGMPSSESLALVSALSASSLFYNGFFDMHRMCKIFIYLIISCFISFVMAYALSKAMLRFKKEHSSLLIAGCCLSSFIHGAQDGQKFIGIFILLAGIRLEGSAISVKILIIATVGIFMLLGTLCGGEKIVKSLGERVVKLNTRSAFSSDLGGFLSLLACTVLKVPVSTGNVKASSILGVGVAGKDRINKKVAAELIITSVATVPICFALGYLLCFLLEII